MTSGPGLSSTDVRRHHWAGHLFAERVQMIGPPATTQAIAARLALARRRAARRAPGTDKRTELLRSLDDPGFKADPYPFFDAIRTRGGLVASNQPGAWITADHELVSMVLRHAGFRISQPGGRSVAARRSPLSPSLLDLDPPDHTRIRRLAAQTFAPRAVEALREPIRQIAHALLDTAGQSGRMDLITEFAAPLPIRVICYLLGIPADDIGRIRQWGTIVGSSLDGIGSRAEQRRIELAARHLARYFANLFEAHRREPRDDLLQVLLDAHEDDEQLSQEELVATCCLLLIAGFETTVNLIGNGSLAMLRNPDQWKLLVSSHRLIPNAVEEMLRYDAPVQLVGRTASEAMTLAGVALARGDTVGVFIGGANRDPSVFAEPAVFDIERANARDHLSFSGGIHYCLGSALARLEGQIALEVLTERCPELRADGFEERRETRILRGLSHLPVTWT
jgi:cytochrome P450